MQTTNIATTQELSAMPTTMPHTAGFPVIGSIPALLRHQTDYLFDGRHTHGDVHELNLGLVSIMMLNNPEYAQHILRDKIRNYATGGEIVGECASV